MKQQSLRASRSYSDDELRELKLVITSPEDQDGLVWDIPKGTTDVKIINAYIDARWPKAKCLCAGCRARRHRKGFTVLLPDGMKTLLGSRCGAKMIGTSWEEARREYDDLRSLQSSIFREDELRRALPLIQAGLTSLRKFADRLHFHRNAWKSQLPELWDVLRQRATTDGKLIVFQRVRDFKAEANAADDDKEQKFKHIETLFHILGGRALFDPADPLKLCDESRDAVSTLLSDLAKPDRRERRGVGRRAQNAFEKVERLLSMLSAVPVFFGTDNALKVAAWASQTTDVPGKYRAGTGRLERVDTDTSPAVTRPDLAGLDDSWASLMRSESARKAAA